MDVSREHVYQESGAKEWRVVQWRVVQWQVVMRATTRIPLDSMVVVVLTPFFVERHSQQTDAE